MIWLIGNKGMLGSDVQNILAEKKYIYYTTDKEVDITNLLELKKFIVGKNIQWIINCSAYTSVDKAEDEEKKAYDVNFEGVKNITAIAMELDAKFIHISTDYVFDGEKDIPYIETDPNNPIGIYGKSKLNGEKAIIDMWNKYFIIRTSWLYGKYGNNFVTTIIRLLNERDEVNIVADQKGSPTYTKDLANFISIIIDKDSNDFGIYHFSNEGITTWFDFAIKIKEYGENFSLINNNSLINPIQTSSYPTKAKRPKYSVLCKDKVKKIFKYDISKWEDSLLDYFSDLN